MKCGCGSALLGMGGGIAVPGFYSMLVTASRLLIFSNFYHFILTFIPLQYTQNLIVKLLTHPQMKGKLKNKYGIF